jgi:hypothetical protein
LLLFCHPVAVNIYTQTIYIRTQITTNVEECGPHPVFASFTLAFALKPSKNHGKFSVRVSKTSEYSIYITKTPTQYKTHTNTHVTKLTHTYLHTYIHTHTPTHTHTHTHTLQNNIKPPQYKLKQTQHKIYPNQTVTI